MRVDRLHRLAVERAASLCSAGGQSNRDWHRDIGPPIMRPRIIQDLVQRDARKIGKLHLNDRPHAMNGGANGGPDHGVLTDWRIQDTAREFGGQAFGGLKRTSESSAYVLAVDKDAIVIAQEFGLRFANGL